MLRPESEPSTGDLKVVVNWYDELQRLGHTRNNQRRDRRSQGQQLVDVQASGSDSDHVASVRQLDSGRPNFASSSRRRLTHLRLATIMSELVTSIAAIAMDLTAGQYIGPYEIVSPLGAGGMGEVYRARDTKLKRDVALKILPAHVSRDVERLARFEREARVLASLNHPHIGTIYGVDETDGVRALILELVEGPTLAERLGGGPAAGARGAVSRRARSLKRSTRRTRRASSTVT